MKDRLLQLPVIGTALRMQQRYTDDAADALAASIGFFGFLSLFPLLALVLAVVGTVLDGDVVGRQRLVDLVLDSVPALGAIAGGENGVGDAINYIAENPGQLFGIGSIGLVVAGLRIANGAQQACVVVFRRDMPSGLLARFAQVRALVLVGLLALFGTALTGSVGVELSSGLEGVALSVVGTVASIAVDVALFLLAYRLFTPGDGPPWRVLLPGALLAGTGWVALKLFGTSYVASQASSADSNFGALGSIIALLLLFYLAGRLFMYGAELAALLGNVDEVPSKEQLAQDAVRVPVVSTRPFDDVAPDPADAARLAVSGVVLGAAAAVIGRSLQD